MREWLKANGGPLAFVVIGVGLLAPYFRVGIGLIVVGVVGWIFTALRHRLPFTIVSRRAWNEAIQREQEYSRWFDHDIVRRLLTARLGEMFPGKKKGSDVQDLREEAHQIRTLLREAGYETTARRFEVTLGDDASRGAIDARWETLERDLVRLLLWDSFVR